MDKKRMRNSSMGADSNRGKDGLVQVRQPDPELHVCEFEPDEEYDLTGESLRCVECGSMPSDEPSP